MLRANLSTRPFYNERAVRAGLAMVALAAAGLTIFNVVEVSRLRARNDEFRRRAGQNDTEARSLRDQARTSRQSLNPAQLEAAHAAAREANLLIERRAFSWTELFNQFEQTLPSDVRVSAVQPQIDQSGRLLLSITVVTRTAEALDAFIEALEKTGSFRSVLSRQEQADDDGTIKAVLQGYYGAAADAAAAASGGTR